MRYLTLLILIGTSLLGQTLTTTTLSVPQVPYITLSNPVTLTATVAPASTGFVSFLDGSRVLGSASLVNSQATITVRFPVVGHHSLKAVYRGNAGNAASSSAVSVVSVTTQQVSGFIPGSSLSIPSQQFFIADVNGDGRQDIVSTFGNVRVALNQGGGAFANPVQTTVPGNLQSLGAADVNGDGRADLVLYETNKIYLALGQSNGAFAAPAIAATLSRNIEPRYLRLELTPDVNGDGLSDLVVFAANPDTAIIALSNGTTFSEHASFPANPVLFGAEDWNNDGRLDFVSLTVSTGICSVALNNGVSFTTVPQPCASADQLYTGDFNGDGKADILTKTITAGLIFYKGVGNGQFATGTRVFDLPPQSTMLMPLDYDSDGRLDIVLDEQFSQHSVITIRFFRADGTLSDPKLFAGGATSDQRPFDFNEDGYQDFLYYDFSGSATPLYGTASAVPAVGSFSSTAVTDGPYIGLQPVTATFSDANGAADLASFEILIGDPNTPQADCILQYIPASPLGPEYTFLRNAAGSAAASSQTSNERCSVRGVSQIYAGSVLSIIAHFRFSSTFTGSKRLYLRTVDRSGQDTGYVDSGNIAIASSVVPFRSVVFSANPAQSNIFTVKVDDNDGAGDLRTVQLLISGDLDGAGACFVQLNLPSQQVSLFNDAGSGFAGAAVAGTAAVIQNKQCRIDLHNVQVSSAGKVVSWTIPIGFKAVLTGQRQVYVRALDAFPHDSGFTQLATYEVPEIPFTPVSLTPTSGTGNARFRAKFTHAAGSDQHYLGYILILPTPNVASYTAAGSCLIEYNRISNGMRLIDDGGTGWLGGVSGVPIEASAQPLSNRVCTLDVASSNASVSGQEMTVEAAVTFKPGFSGTLATFIQGQDINGMYTPMQQFGNWIAFPAAVPAPGPYINGISPISGSGTAATFVVSAGHTSGVSALSRVHLLFDIAIVSVAPCHIVYFPQENALNLVNDSGTALVSPSNVPLGSTPATLLTNSRCSVNTTSASRSVSGNNVNLSLPISFQFPNFSFAKNIYINAFDNSGKLTHWVQSGVWSVQ